MIPPLAVDTVKTILHLLTGLEWWGPRCGDGSCADGKWYPVGDDWRERRRARVFVNESCGEFRVTIYED